MWIINILAFNLTLVLLIELSLGYAFGARSKLKFANVALSNIITNPAVVLTALCLTFFYPEYEAAGIFVLEVFAVLIEGFIYSKTKTFNKKNPYLISLILNTLSYISGEIIEKFL